MLCMLFWCTTRTLDSVPGGNFISMNILNCSQLYSPLQSRYFVFAAWISNERTIINDNYLNSYHEPLPRTVYASVNSKHQYPPGLTPGEFFKVVKFPVPGQKIFAKLRPRGKKIDKNPAPGDNFVDLQDNFATIVKPFAFFWYSSLAWLSSSIFKDYKAYEYKISQW